MKWGKPIFLILSLICFITMTPPSAVFAATSHTVNYVDVSNTSLGQESVNDGLTNTFPVVTDLLAWINTSTHEAVTQVETITQDVTYIAVTANDCAGYKGEFGYITGGYPCIWFIYDDVLYITSKTGDGYIVCNATTSTGSITYEQGFEIDGNTVYSSITTDAKKYYYANGGNEYFISPWLDTAYAVDTLKEISISSEVSLSGSFAGYFNCPKNVTTGTIFTWDSLPTKSLYENVETIYLFADLSHVKTMSGMIAYMPALKNVFVKDSGADLTECEDLSFLFYGCQALKCDESDGYNLINNMKNTGAVTDIRFMNYGCKSLYKPHVAKWNTASVDDASYAFTGCINANLIADKANTTANERITDLDFSNLKYMIGTFAGTPITMTSPTVFDETTGGTVINSDICLDNDLTNLKAMTYAFANNNAAAITSITIESDLSGVEEASAAFALLQNAVTCDLSQTALAPNKAIKILYADNKLDTLLLPGELFDNIADINNDALKAFYWNKTTPTDLTVTTSALSSGYKNYKWADDNRHFIKELSHTINGTAGVTYTLVDATDSAAMLLGAESNFKTYTAGVSTPLPITYDWVKSGSTTSLGSTNTYTSTEHGTYVASAQLADLKNADKLTKNFTISPIAGTKVVASIKATYNGPKIKKGLDYSKDNVTVTATYTDGTSAAIANSDFSVDSKTVTAVGDNTFTATYNDGANNFTATFKVKGYRLIKSIEAEYIGPSVATGTEIDTSKVIVTAYYEDDTAKAEGFKVTPTAYDTKTITFVGSNTITVMYETDYTNGKLTDTINVTGYARTVSSITATYNGSDIVVGNNYNKSNVVVTIHYTDGTTQKASSFGVDSTYVSKVGSNSYKASYTSGAYTYTASFVVKGIEKASNVTSSTNTTPPTTTTNGGVKTGDESTIAIWIIIAMAALVIIGITNSYFRKNNRNRFNI